MSDTIVVDVSQDWETACDVQQGFMQHPAPAAEGVSYSARCRQLRALGGDCYDFIPLPQSRLAFAIGDASGKSLPAALMIANVQSSMRTAAHFAGESPEEVLGAVNRQLHRSSLSDRFATLFYGVFDPATRILRYASAGHPRPILLMRDGSVAWLDNAGFPLGLFTDTTYDVGSVQLELGDTVIAYTDGVIELVGPLGEEWGVDGVRKAAVENRERCPDDLIDTIFAGLDQHSHGRQTDDATMIVFRTHLGRNAVSGGGLYKSEQPGE
jgi:sigma-B regulation protein RsbU (phosphoserine phosphatase)